MSWTDYKRLLKEQNTDPRAWQAAGKANPNDPLTACKIAVEAEPWEAAVVLLLLARQQAEPPALYELLSDAAAAVVNLPTKRESDAALAHFARELVGFGVNAGRTLGDLRGLAASLQNELTDAILWEVDSERARDPAQAERV